MACWPANIVGAFFISVLIFDAIIGDYEDLLPHSVAGIISTLLFWLVCIGLGEKISGAVLLIPSVVAIVFVASLWFFGQSMKNRGYCMSRGQGDQCLDAPPKPTCLPPPPPKPKCPPPKPKCKPPKPKCPS
jgi:hypothetical protein